MSSNKYYREWVATNTNTNTNTNCSNKKEIFQHSILKKLEKDINRLDRAIDKIETEDRAKKIFKFGKQINSCELVQLGQLGQLGQLVQLPVEYASTDTQYIIINGHLMMY